MVRPTGLEPVACGLGNRRSIHLSYGRPVSETRGNLAQLVPARVPSVRDQRFDGAARPHQALAALEERQLDDEEEGAHLALLLSHQLRRAPGGAAGGEQVVDDRHLLARPYRVDVRLEDALAVLQSVLDPVRLVGKLPQLADGREADLQAIRQGGAEDESARLDGNDAIERATAQPPFHVVENGLERLRLAEDRRDVLEEDARLGEVGNVADQRADLYQGAHSPHPRKKPAAGPMGGVGTDGRGIGRSRKPVRCVATRRVGGKEKRQRRNPRGSRGWMPTRTSKCRCGPVALPVFPTRAICSPRDTLSPCETRFFALWAYTVTTSRSWASRTRFPYPRCSPEKSTIPSSAARTGVPSGHARSIPSW